MVATKEFWTLHRARGPYTGSFPIGFLSKLERSIGPFGLTLQPFGGISQKGITCDLNISETTKPTIRADAHYLPFRDNCFNTVILDPPYEQTFIMHYADLQRIPRQKSKIVMRRCLLEASRVTRPNGQVALLHYITAANPDRVNLSLRKIIALSLGPQKRLRAITVFQKTPIIMLEPGVFDGKHGELMA